MPDPAPAPAPGSAVRPPTRIRFLAANPFPEPRRSNPPMTLRLPRLLGVLALTLPFTAAGCRYYNSGGCDEEQWDACLERCACSDEDGCEDDNPDDDCFQACISEDGDETEVDIGPSDGNEGDGEGDGEGD